MDFKIKKSFLYNTILYLIVILSFISYEYSLYRSSYDRIISIIIMLGVVAFLVGMTEKKYKIIFFHNVAKNNALAILSILLILSMLISSLKFGYVSFLGLARILLMITSIYIFYLFIPSLISDIDDKVKKLIILITLFSIIAIIIALNGSFFNYKATHYPRVSSIFFDPNYFAVIAGVGLILSMHKKGIYRWVSIINLLALIYSGSRGTMLSLAIVLVGFYYYRKKPNIKTILIFIILMFIGYQFFIYLQNSGFLRTYQGFSGRESLWKISFELMMQEPLWGYGTDAIADMLSKRGISNVSTHNAYLDFILAHGLIPFLLYSMVILKGIYMGYVKEIDSSIMKCIFFLLINANSISINLGGVGATSLMLTLFLGYSNLQRTKI
ncbi:O-antigen ligase like membrane protein [Anaerobranca californiensis DSM 14826]|uniref:O-antigen ligase like membrane protein n=1 Tax=Anaerobranca californiensis DSM 14826 TaxID=1120989 RepID=A0A1M6RK01_9FIRM|nr:O-antigen ligase family protein [Anaerobranca californiensis]SHK32749.1 O-antigen ligase like membrane protein [Anaerobranca californiensis DSM 14826]